MLYLLLASLFSLSVHSTEFTPVESDGFDFDILGEDFNLAINGEINIGGTASYRNGRDLFAQESFLELSLQWRRRVRLQVALKLEAALKESSIQLTEDFSLGEFIRDAYIEIREIGGKNVILIVGKRNIPISIMEDDSFMPFNSEGIGHELRNIKEVFGFTLETRRLNFLGFEDASVSFFETEGGDFRVGDIDGFSVRLTHNLKREDLDLVIGHTRLGNGHLDTDAETRTNIGLIYNQEKYAARFEVFYLNNNPNFPDARLATVTGIRYDVNSYTQVVMETTLIFRELMQISLGVKTNLTSRLSVGAEVGYIRNFDDKDEVYAGVSLKYRLGNVYTSYNDAYLFNGIEDWEDLEEGEKDLDFIGWDPNR